MRIVRYVGVICEFFCDRAGNAIASRFDVKWVELAIQLPVVRNFDDLRWGIRYALQISKVFNVERIMISMIALDQLICLLCNHTRKVLFESYRHNDKRPDLGPGLPRAQPRKSKFPIGRGLRSPSPGACSENSLMGARSPPRGVVCILSNGSG